MRRGHFVIALVAVVAGVVLVVGLSSAGSDTGRKAPELPHEVLVGHPTSIARLTGGHRDALVLFWAGWCEPCQHEAAAVEKFATGPGKGRIVTVDWTDPLGDARAFVQKYHWTMTVLRDGGESIGFAYHLTGLPTTFVINPEGRIVRELRGPQSEASLEQALG